LSEKGWKTLEDRTGFDSPHLKVHEEKVATPRRPHGVDWIRAGRKQAVVVAPFTPDGKLLLILQERIPIRRTIWEFPAGQIDFADVSESDIREHGARELREETGYLCDPDEMESLGVYFSSAGFTDERMHLYAARNVRPAPDGAQPDDAECIPEVRAFAPDEIWEMIRTCVLVDANTLSLCARLRAHRYL